eukprot:1462413-Amphidinium_carterae.1
MRSVELQLMEYALDIMRNLTGAGGGYKFLQTLMLQAAAESEAIGNHVIETITFLANYTTDYVTVQEYHCAEKHYISNSKRLEV